MFFSNDLLRLWLKSVQYDLQNDFAWVTDEADRLVVLALLQVAFLEKCTYGFHENKQTKMDFTCLHGEVLKKKIKLCIANFRSFSQLSLSCITCQL